MWDKIINLCIEWTGSEWNTWSNIANTLLVALCARFLVAALPLGLREDIEDMDDDEDNGLSLFSSFDILHKQMSNQ